jgi:hypothetical protein
LHTKIVVGFQRHEEVHLKKEHKERPICKDDPKRTKHEHKPIQRGQGMENFRKHVNRHKYLTKHFETRPPV